MKFSVFGPSVICFAEKTSGSYKRKWVSFVNDLI